MGLPDGLRDAPDDRYAVEREFGRGGMAVVYLAQDPATTSSPGWLRLDPTFDAPRTIGGLRKLVEGTA